MIAHECTISNIWHMNEGMFTRACWACLYSGTAWPLWADNVEVSDVRRARMEIAVLKGYRVDTDGSDILVYSGDNILPLHSVLTDEEWESAERYTYG